MHIDIIYDDDDVFVINKPAGLLVHGTQSRNAGDEKTLVKWIVKRYPEIARVGDDPAKRPGIVHRLDRDTSGVMIIAKKQRTFIHLKNLFKNRDIKKTYRAIVYGAMPKGGGIIEKPISIKPGTVVRTVHGGKMTKEALTEYRALQVFKDFSWVEILPKTGRTHQVRLHLASINHPIVGDPLYGKKRKITIPGVTRQMLHAYSAEFSLPRGKRIRVVADLPADMANALEYLRGIDSDT